jgi:hypothetical protein
MDQILEIVKEKIGSTAVNHPRLFSIVLGLGVIFSIRVLTGIMVNGNMAFAAQKIRPY